MNEQLPMMTTEDADDALFGATDRNGLILAKPISIRLIWADIKQPRRVFPAEIRGDWQGSPQRVPEMLRQWHEIVEGILDEKIIAANLVMVNGDTFDRHESEIVNDYFSLCALAGSVVHDKLTNPISVVSGVGGIYLIETGERRWLAHHLLLMYAHNRYEKIAAQIVDKADVYRQANENSARASLNAISMARQLALLLMSMHGVDQFDTYETLVLPGECDRKYYAQVANGKLWPVKRGQGARILSATGIKNAVMLNRYRDLLNLTDQQWNTGDDENWSEGALRVLRDDDRERERLEKERNEDHDELPIGNTEDGVDVGDYVQTTAHGCGFIEKFTIDDVWAYVKLDDQPDMRAMAFEKSSLVRVPLPHTLGDWVETLDGKHGEIIGFTHNFIFSRVKMAGSGNIREVKTSTLTAADRTSVTGGDDSSDELLVQGVDADGEFVEETIEYPDADDLDYAKSYIPETHEDAIPAVNEARPELAKLLNALHMYYYDNDAIADEHISWSIDDLMESRRSIEHDMKQGDHVLFIHQKRFKKIKKTMRSYLEQIAGHVDEWCAEIEKISMEYHAELWGDDDES
jgi:hypothetical protein